MPATALRPEILAICRAVRDAGGRALFVGGWVRDRLRGLDAKDVDVEVFGLELARLAELLARFGPVIEIGRAFGVLRIKGLDVDFSLPRRDSKVGAGHRGFDVDCDPRLDFATAARRRDLTINSISFDPLTEEVIDPHGGRRDLERGLLRATDPLHFPEDPLRGVRVAQFAARFEMQPDAELVELCSRLDLSELPGERLFEELRKLLLKGARPSIGLAFLERTRLLRFLPQLDALRGVPQDPVWHPEGDVWVHTLMVVDEAARLRSDGDLDLALMFGALCHDLGKPLTTSVQDGRVVSPAHDVEGDAPTRALLERLRAPGSLVERVVAHVRHHLAPALLDKQNSGPKAYRRLARRLEAAGLSMAELERVARADHLGRTTEEALARRFPAGDAFLARAAQLAVTEHAQPDAVQGRHLIARGLRPGPEFGRILARCRDLQDETGWDDPQRLLDAVMEEG
ncbi:MAG TPA: HD domain-containing protein [Myxococcota bacterium]|nr:HD domain-containing protein [Myxococcota bacterium]